MRTVSAPSAARAACLLSLAIVGAGACDDSPTDASGGGTPGASASTTSTSSSSSSSSSASSSSGGCVQAQDCPIPSSPCEQRACVAGQCASIAIGDGSLAAVQIPHDCLDAICSGGVASSVPNASDVEDDSELCTVDSCSGGAPVHTPAAASVDCSAQGPAPKKVCGDPAGQNAGLCVECNVNADCGGAATCCPSGCADLTSDPLDCGECGRDCGGGACMMGVCGEVVVTATHADHLGVDATHVYLGDSQGLRRIPKAGGAVAVVTTQPATYFVLDATHAYLDNEAVGTQPIYRVPLGGGALETVAQSEYYPGTIATDGDKLVWVTQLGQVRWAPKSGPAGSVSGGFNNLRGIAADAGVVYWTHPDTGVQLYKAPIATSAPTTLLTSVNTAAGVAYAVAVSGGNVYFAVGTSVYRVPAGGGTATLFHAGGPTGSVRELLVDSQSVVVAGTAGTVELSLGGQVKQVLTTTDTRSIALDDAFVYWATGNSVLKRAR